MPKRPHNTPPKAKKWRNSLVVYLNKCRHVLGKFDDPVAHARYEFFVLTGKMPPASSSGGVLSHSGTFNCTCCANKNNFHSQITTAENYAPHTPQTPPPLVLQGHDAKNYAPHSFQHTPHAPQNVENGQFGQNRGHFPAFSSARQDLVGHLVKAYLEYAGKAHQKRHFAKIRTTLAWLVDVDKGNYALLPVNSFTSGKLVALMDLMVESKTMNRDVINAKKNLIIQMFQWGTVREIVTDRTLVPFLREVKSLPKGYPGTYEGEGSDEDVPLEVILRWLPFATPTIAAMVQIQGYLGVRPQNIYTMTVGEIDTGRGNGLWYFVPLDHKTIDYIGAIELPMGAPEQELLAPFLVGKKPENAVFNRQTALLERLATLPPPPPPKTKMTPSRKKRDALRKKNAKPGKEFFDKDSYLYEVEKVTERGNEVLPDGKKIPHWTPYQIRHFAATITEKERGIEYAQALLGHRNSKTTENYVHNDKEMLRRREQMAHERKNIFVLPAD